MAFVGREHVFGLDLLRALAILLVLISHASFMFLPLTHDLEAWWMLGQFGVELFFVLSGFLIGGILLDQAGRGNLDVGHFWMRRWLRTLPNYYLFLLINLLLARVTSGAWPHAWGYIFFAQNLAWPVPMFYGESWSLAIEEIFYLAAPLLVLACNRLRLRAGAVSLVCGGIALFTAVRIGFVFWQDPGWDEGVRKVAVVRLDAIAYGVVAVMLFRRWRRGGAVATWLALLGALGTGAAIWCYLALPRDDSFFARTLLFNLVSISFALFLPWAALWRHSGWPKALDIAVVKLALWSYALYVSQLALNRVLVEVFGWNGTSMLECLAQALAFMAMAIGLAALVYYSYERPLLRVRDRMMPKVRPARG